MIISKLLACLPAVYYVSTRYNSTYKRVIFLLKYWGPYILLLLFFNVNYILEESTILLLSFLIFNNLYDYFCYENENFSVNSETNAIRRGWNMNVTFVQFITIKALMAFLLNVILYTSARGNEFFYVFMVQGALIIVFVIHNRVRVTIRPMSFFFLYVLKGLVFGMVLLDEFANDELFIYLAFVVFYSMSYIPKYTLKKLAGVSIDEVRKSGFIGIIEYVVIQPIFYKNLFLLLFSLLYVNGLFLIIYINILTGIEFFFDMMSKKHREINAKRV